MENGGNAKVNAIFEAFLNVAKPTQSANGQVRERFVRDKYERRKFYDPNAFAAVNQMESEREQDEVVIGVQQRLATSRAPSDAARKRVEERAAKNYPAGEGAPAASSNIGGMKSPRSQAPPPAPAPARVVDLLDFGDFNSFEATSAVQASATATSTFGVTNYPPAPAPAPTVAPPVPQLSNSEPQLDLFAKLAIENEVNIQQPPGQPQQPAEKKKMTTDDIMSMFNTPSAQHNPMPQNMFQVNGTNMPNVTMMHGMHPQQMAMMNGMIPQQPVGMMNGMIPQQQLGMMNNIHAMQMQSMMVQHGMNNMGSNMNAGSMGGQGMGVMGGNNMMLQQGHMPHMNNAMMMQGGQVMVQGGNHYGQQLLMMGQTNQLQQDYPSPHLQQRGGNNSNHQAFSEFGNF